MKASLRDRLLVALAALVLLPVFVTPAWTIRLVAPQYPEGMGFYIGVSEVWGHDEFDIQNINILNHYVGMKPIDPEGIPELDIFPPILAAIIVAGLIAAAMGRRWLMAAWLVGLVGLAIAALVVLRVWMIDYGHNLDPRAAIRVPGMTYTPPLIGTEQLLNITASSWPHIGSLFLGISIALAGWAVVSSFRRERAGDAGGGRAAAARRKGVSLAAPALAGALLLAGCGQPDAGTTAARTPADRMVYGESVDPYCGELVQSVRWGGEIRTVGGEVLRFRSVECMAAYVLEQRLGEDEIASIRAVDFPDGWRLIDVQAAHFLHTPNLASPAQRGLNIMAIGTERMARNLQDAYTGPVMGWEEVLHTVAVAWGLDPPPGCPFHAEMAVNE